MTSARVYERNDERGIKLHREAVARNSAARKAAQKRLIEAHRAEYEVILEEEKTALGIRTHKSRRAARIQEQEQQTAEQMRDAKFRDLMAKHPHLPEAAVWRLVNAEEAA